MVPEYPGQVPPLRPLRLRNHLFHVPRRVLPEAFLHPEQADEGALRGVLGACAVAAALLCDCDDRTNGGELAEEL